MFDSVFDYNLCMAIPPIPDSAHPVLGFVAGVQERLAGLVDRVGFMTPAETAAALQQLRAAGPGSGR